MEYKFLKYLNKSEIKELEDLLLGVTSNEDLLNEIQLLKDNIINVGSYNFDSSFIPNYDEELENKCVKVLKQIKANDLFFFLSSFRNKGNTRYLRPTADFYREVMDKSVFENLEILINLTWKTYTYYESGVKMKPNLSLNKVNNMFEYSNFCKDFEGPYNMLNYIKNYIYLLLSSNKEIDGKDVFDEYQEKKQLVTIQFKDISSYLYEIRNGTNLRLCISNAGLSRNISKVGDNLTFDQQLFRDALAFGTTLEKIENRDYEDYKKLLYLPNGKKLIK